MDHFKKSHWESVSGSYVLMQAFLMQLFLTITPTVQSSKQSVSVKLEEITV